MRKLLIFLRLCFLVSFSSVYAQTTDSIVIKSSELEFISVRRLSDIFSILPQLDIYTIDKYRHSSLYGNLFENTSSDMIVLIDGVKTNYGFLDKVNLSQFPVHPNTIDSIVIKYYPTLYLGEYSSGIVIDIITKKPPEDLSFLLTYSTGNEVGDPGPYRYTEYFSDNVDQFGPNTLFSSSYGSENFNLTFNYVYQVSPTTDPAILNRTDDFVFQNYQVHYSGLSLNASIISSIGNHNLFSALAKAGQPFIGSVYGADLYFVDDLSTELPYESESLIISSGNEIYLNEKSHLNIDFNIKSSRENQSEFSDDISFNTNDLWLFSKVRFESSIGLVKYLLGSSFEYQNLTSSTENFNHKRNIPALFTNIEFQFLENLTHTVAFNYRDENKSSGFFASIKNKYEFNYQNHLAFTLSSGNLFNIDNSLSQRIKSSLTFMNDNYRNNKIPNDKRLFYLFILEYDYKLNMNLTLSTGAAYNINEEFIYVLNDFMYDEIESSIKNNKIDEYISIQGTIGEYYINLLHKPSRNFEHKIFYRYKSYLSGDEIFKQAIQRIPQHKLFYSFYYTPYRDLIGSLTLTYLSTSKFIEYRNISSGDDDLYRSELYSNFLVNCTVTKSFWKEKIKVSTAIENLFNNRIQYHPVGSTFDLTFFLKLEANLESIL